MPLPRSRPLGETLDRAQASWQRLADDAQDHRARLNAGSVSGGSIASHAERFAQASADLTALKSEPGIGAYAVEEFSGYAAATEIATDLDTMIAALDAVVAEVGSLLGTDPIATWDSTTGTVSYTQYSKAQTNSLRSALDAVVAAVAV